MNQIVEFLKETKLIAIARRIPVKDIVDTARALFRGGINAIEITFDQSSEKCIENTAESIALVKSELGSNMCVGAGTVLNLQQVRAAYEAGADFILSPDTNIEVIKEVKKLGMVAVPGALTPSEIMTAWNAGADIVKLFPAGNFGLDYYKAIKGPISHVPLMAVGGVNENNVNEFLKAGFCSCGIGSNLVRNDLINQGRFEELTKLTKNFVNAK